MTIDAIGCQKELVKTIIERKQNQPALYAATKEVRYFISSIAGHGAFARRSVR